MATTNTILAQGSRYLVVAGPGIQGPEGPEGPAGPVGADGVPGSEGSWRQTMAFEIFDIHTDAVTRGWWCPANTRIVGDVFADIDQMLTEDVQWTIEYWDGATCVSLFSHDTTDTRPVLVAGTMTQRATPNQHTVIPHATFIRLRIVYVGAPTRVLFRDTRTFTSGLATLSNFTMNYPEAAEIGDDVIVVIVTSDQAEPTPPDGMELIDGPVVSTEGGAVSTTNVYRGKRPALGTGWEWTLSKPCAVVATASAFIAVVDPESVPPELGPVDSLASVHDTEDVEFERNSVAAWPHASSSGTALVWHAAATPAGMEALPEIEFDPSLEGEFVISTGRSDRDNVLVVLGRKDVVDCTPTAVVKIGDRLLQRRRGWASGTVTLSGPETRLPMAASFMAQLVADQPAP